MQDAHAGQIRNLGEEIASTYLERYAFALSF